MMKILQKICPFKVKFLIKAYTKSFTPMKDKDDEVKDMSNRIRRCEPDLTYHASSRCAHREQLMKLSCMKELMITVLNKAMEKYSFELLSYAIMDNHFHFFIRTLPGEASISRIMQFIKAQYARRYNKIMKRTGPFWNERFSDTIIEESDDPQFAFNYINNYILQNPVKAHYVRDARNYKFCSIHFYLDPAYISPVKLTFHKYFLLLGNTFEERSKKFLEFEEMYKKRIIPGCIYF